MDTALRGQTLAQAGSEASGRQRLNDLDGRTWTRYSISVWDIVKTQGETRFHHPAMFPVELCRRLIEVYTRPGELVLDPFMGSGSTLVAAQELARRAIGLDVNPAYVKLARNRLSQTGSAEPALHPELHCLDAKDLLKVVKPQSVDLVVTSPPYWNVHRRRRSADHKESRPYSTLAADLGNITEYTGFLGALGSAFAEVHEALRPGKRCVVVLMDLRVKSAFIPFHMDVTQRLRQVGFVLEDIMIWDRRKEYNNLRPLGFPYVFVVNKVHEYLLIFRREEQTDRHALGPEPLDQNASRNHEDP